MRKSVSYVKKRPVSHMTVREKGKETLLHFSKLRKNGELEKVLNERTIVKVHATCRRDYTNV